MSEEQKNEDVVENVVDNQEQTETPTTKQVELGGGVKVEMSVEDFEKYKENQDSRNADFNEIKSQLDAITQKEAEAKARAELREKEKRETELAQAGKMDELKKSISQEYDNIINDLKGKVKAYEVENTKGKIKDAALKIENVNTAALDDIVQLSMNNIQEGVSIEETVKNLVSSRDYFQMVKSPAGTGNAKSVVRKKAKVDTNEQFNNGVEKLLNKNKK